MQAQTPTLYDVLQLTIFHFRILQDADPLDQDGLMNANVYISFRAMKLISEILRSLLAVVAVGAVGHFVYERLLG